MESLDLLLAGFSTALEPTNLLFALAGCILGMLVGVLPGIGPVAGTAILLPVTATIGPTGAVIMLCAIYYGAMYGGTITSVLINVPGEGASAITCLDGYEMARQGRAGQALAIAAIGSFIGGLAATVGLVMLAKPLTALALKFGPPEFFALMLVGLSLVTGLAGNSIIRALVSATIGLIVAMVGIDPVMGAPRFTFGSLNLIGGIDVVIVAMGLFGVGEILLSLERKDDGAHRRVKSPPLNLSRDDVQRSAMPILRGTTIGFFLGLIPGVGAMVPTVMSYVTERKLSKTPKKFGTGMIEGVAGPETANNAYANAALIPLFTLGIPGSPTVAIIMGAFMMNGIVPGPFLFRDHGAVVWGVIASFCIGNAILLVLNLPLIPLWVKIIQIPRGILYAVVLGFCILGAYCANGQSFDILLMAIFGIVGYAFKKVDIPLAPMILTLILGPQMEQSLRQSLEISGGSFAIFVTQPISLTLILVALCFVALSTRNALAPVRGADSEV